MSSYETEVENPKEESAESNVQEISEQLAETMGYPDDVTSVLE